MNSTTTIRGSSPADYKKPEDLIGENGLLVCLLVTACTHGLAVPTCTIATSATLSFGAVVALASTADVTTNGGSSFWINCTLDVTAAFSLHSATTQRC